MGPTAQQRIKAQCATLLGAVLVCSALLGACADAAATLTVAVIYPPSYGERNAAGATVTVRQEATGREFVATTDAAGRARFDTLTPGEYAVSAHGTLAPERTLVLTGHPSAVELNGIVTGVVATDTRTTDVAVALDGPQLGSLVIGQVYYPGAPGVSGHYFHDQFVELYNNSTHPIDVGGLLIADLHGASGEINEGDVPSPLQAATDFVYASSVWQVPVGDSPLLLAPGASLVVAQDGTNHQPDSVLDLSDADFEAFNERADQGDRDHPTVPNLVRVHFDGGYDWLMTVFGPAVVIARVEDPAQLEEITDPETRFFRLRAIPVAQVIDAFEALMDERSGGFSRVPDTLDRGFVYATGTYTGESAQRRVVARVADRAILQDTNDSAADFTIAASPTPRAY